MMQDLVNPIFLAFWLQKVTFQSLVAAKQNPQATSCRRFRGRDLSLEAQKERNVFESDVKNET